MARVALVFSLLALALQSQLFPGEGRKFTIVNNCTYTVWPASDTTSMQFSLRKDETKVIDLPNGWSKLWGRTLCDKSTGKFTCRTGNCGSGNTNCSDASILNATTLANFGLNQFDGVDYYAVSFVSGYNLAMMVAPVTSFCKPTGCIFDVGGACPKQLRFAGACKSPCEGFVTSEYCCTGRDAGACKPTNISLVFKKACPRAYTYPLDVPTSTMSCKGAPNYTVIFCPSRSSMDRAFSKPIQPWPSPSPLPSPSHSPSPSPSPSPSSSPSPLSVPSAKANATSRGAGHPPKGNSGKRRKRLERTSLLVSVPIATSIMLLSGIWVCVHKRKAMKRHNAEINEIVTVESLQFNLNTIRTATCNFSAENKLGQGGFGEVYKGKLESGQEVAIKRLSKNSGQGVAEFKTEVVLVAKLQHKNLVKLLGFCVASKEKILVYEYLPNSSLDKFLSDPTNNESLDWPTRLKIIVGIARGLLYLHEESRLKVIHRDLKTSNILLDEDMNPKISDFGLAKLFGVDQTEGDTNRIVGTYGYMAPEYAITGHYSVKSDVYSFGVIVLEIVSGQKNRFFGRVQLEEALLHRAWRLWNEKKPLDLVDRALSNNFPTEEVMKCIHIGLLCIQEDAVQRPRMTLIVTAFSGQSINLPMPKPPHFFGSPNTNAEARHALHEDASPYKYTGSKTITDLYPRE